jgi:hypothetical protein
LALVGNTGYRRYLKTISDDHFAIDTDKIEEGKRFDGIFVLRTNTDLNPLDAMLCYKQLWTVEQTFRTAKHLLTTRPIFHKLDETNAVLIGGTGTGKTHWRSQSPEAASGPAHVAASITWSISSTVIGHFFFDWAHTNPRPHHYDRPQR